MRFVLPALALLGGADATRLSDAVQGMQEVAADATAAIKAATKDFIQELQNAIPAEGGPVVAVAMEGEEGVAVRNGKLHPYLVRAVGEEYASHASSLWDLCVLYPLYAAGCTFVILMFFYVFGHKVKKTYRNINFRKALHLESCLRCVGYDLFETFDLRVDVRHARGLTAENLGPCQVVLGAGRKQAETTFNRKLVWDQQIQTRVYQGQNRLRVILSTKTAFGKVKEVARGHIDVTEIINTTGPCRVEMWQMGRRICVLSLELSPILRSQKERNEKTPLVSSRPSHGPRPVQILSEADLEAAESPLFDGRVSVTSSASTAATIGDVEAGLRSQEERAVEALAKSCSGRVLQNSWFGVFRNRELRCILRKGRWMLVSTSEMGEEKTSVRISQITEVSDIRRDEFCVKVGEDNVMTFKTIHGEKPRDAWVSGLNSLRRQLAAPGLKRPGKKEIY